MPGTSLRLRTIAGIFLAEKDGKYCDCLLTLLAIVKMRVFCLTNLKKVTPRQIE
jgi:hypothetical protein